MNNSKQPNLSLVMSVCNGADTLTETLESVLNQEEVDFEFIVINDGSIDTSGAILENYAARDSRLRVFHQENTGLTRALIRGCAEAQGEFIARQDVGDLSLPGRLAAQYKKLKSNPELAFVGCLYQLVGPENEILAKPMPDLKNIFHLLKNRDGTALPGPHHGTVMFRKQSYKKAGGYRPEFYYAQDVDLWSRLIEQGDLEFVPEILYQVKFDYVSITARHRPAQQALRSLIEEAAQRRRAGQEESEVLARAKKIRGNPLADSGMRRQEKGEAAYFVGSCLFNRGDRRARNYLLDALRYRPLHLKAWFKLLKATMIK